MKQILILLLCMCGAQFAHAQTAGSNILQQANDLREHNFSESLSQQIEYWYQNYQDTIIMTGVKLPVYSMQNPSSATDGLGLQSGIGSTGRITVSGTRYTPEGEQRKIKITLQKEDSKWRTYLPSTIEDSEADSLVSVLVTRKDNVR